MFHMPLNIFWETYDKSELQAIHSMVHPREKRKHDARDDYLHKERNEILSKNS